MSYLRAAFLAKNYRNHVEAKGAVLYVVCCKEVAGGPEHSGFLDGGDGELGRTESFIGPGLYLDKGDSPVGIDHDKVNLAGFAGKVASELFEAFAFQQPLAAFFTPSAEQLLIGQQSASVQQQVSYIVFRIWYLAILRRYGRCAAEPA